MKITAFLLIALLNTFLVRAAVPVPANEKFIVVLDAGHGGKDPGNLGNGYMEKKIALKIVLKIGEILEKDPNIKVVYTRRDDTFVELIERGKIANEAKADIFVSVHCDSHGSNAHGAGTFVLGLHQNQRNFEVAKAENESIYFEEDYQTKYAQYNINSPESVIGLTLMQEEFLSQSIDVAKRIQENFTKRLERVDRKVKQAGFVVLHQTFMPSVLVEAGFLTNKKEGAYLNSAKGQSEIGKAIADAIISYKNAYLDDVVVSQPVVENTVVNPKEKTSSSTEKQVVEKTPEAKTLKPITSPTKKSEVVVKKERNNLENKKKEKAAASMHASSIIFKVQLLASSKNIPLNPENFKFLSNISREKFNSLYRYFYGNTASYDQARAYQKVAVNKGYQDCFIVAYKDGQKIPLSQAINVITQ